MLPIPGLPAAPERPPADNRTRDRARTARQRRDVAAGRHPLTGGKTFPDRGTCGTCIHRIRVTWHVKRYPKCDAAGTPTHGAATDVRAWWPACSQHEPRPTDPPGDRPVSHTIAINNSTAAVQLDAYASRRSADGGVAVTYLVEDLIEATRRALHAAGGDLAEQYLARIGDPGAPMPQAPDRGPAVVRPGVVAVLAGIPGSAPTRVQFGDIEVRPDGYAISAVPA